MIGDPKFSHIFQIQIGLIVRFLIAVAVFPTGALHSRQKIESIDSSGGLYREILLSQSLLGSVALVHQRDGQGTGGDSVFSTWNAPSLFTYAGPESYKRGRSNFPCFLNSFPAGSLILLKFINPNPQGVLQISKS